MSVVDALAAGALVGLAVALPLGPVGCHLVGLAARSPRRTAVAAALGVAVVDLGYALAAATGGLVLGRAVARVAPVLELVATAVLVAVGVHAAVQAVRRFRSPVPVGRRTPPSALRAFATTVAMTAVNPATLLTFVAVVVGGAGPTTARGAAAAAFAVAAGAASAAWQLVLVGGGALLGRLLTGRTGQLAVGLASALLLLGLAVGLRVSG
ncbi:Arginine exporter protein ArgO [Friedmanniella luteola]|uniref:Arginine exporter protein ArgO n=1 Tax=Friedmanniella luteola TaxID=546871 RepID=A0A1H1Z619_9ACTN|nr:LysE family transporter [Friedmanniella luteola]SDT28656.1 Arginine exporter protein ArgO [Friedmanniella luteola]